MTVHHSSETTEHYTPPEVLAIPRHVCGAIDLDLCSSQQAQTIVQAGDWFGLDHPEPYMRDGLANHSKWRLAPGTWWCNPPGGKVGRKSLAWTWWDIASFEALWSTEQGDTPIDLWFQCFNLELFRTANRARRHPLEFCVYLFDKRIDYLTPNREREVTRNGEKVMEWIDKDQPAGALVRGARAPHPSALVWVGKVTEEKRDRARNLAPKCAPGRWFGGAW